MKNEEIKAEIESIKARNARVELDKKWETSWTRRIIICVLYWAVQIVGQLLVTKVGLNAFWCIWTPNILVGLFGLAFLSRLLKK